MVSQFLKDFNYVAQFGTAKTDAIQDWVKVIKPTADQLKRQDSNWNAGTRECTHVVGLNVRIITSVLGYEHNLQSYVVGAEVEPVIDSWMYYNSDGDAATTESFLTTVQVTYHQVLPAEVLNNADTKRQFLLPQLPPDVFYPFEISP